VAELKDKFGEQNVVAELVPGAGGVFDVEVDGKRIYSKHETGQFPRYREIVTAIEQLKTR
jgi:selenoprotein W-related protein